MNIPNEIVVSSQNGYFNKADKPWKNQIATLGVVPLHCIKVELSFQRVVAGLKPSFSVDFFVNEGCFVSNMVVVLVGSKVAIVKQPKIVKRLINTGKIKMQRSAQQQ